MRYIVAIFLTTLWIAFLWAFAATASGRITAQPAYSVQTDELLLSAGLLIQEKLPLIPVHYTSFTGVSQDAFPGNPITTWAATRHEIDIPISSRASIAPGFNMSFSVPHDQWRNYVYARLYYKIW